MEDAGPANAVREDPKRKGLLYASTERGVYVSLDDGGTWHSLRLNLPATSVRDLIVKDDDLAVATHGRGFWILDDITPLRQLDAGTAARDAVLFEPAAALRVRWNLSTEMPWPKDEPTLPNPPEGTAITYYLKSAAAGPVSLEILTSTGALVRRYRSDDPVPPAPDESTSSVPLYWYRPPQTLPADAGVHRFYWDMRYQPVAEGGGRGGLSIQAVPHNTTPSPSTPLVAPGTYTVKLTVDGKTYSQPLVVKQDPRVKTPHTATQQLYSLMSGAYFQAREARTAYERARDLQDQVRQRLQAAGGNARTALETFDRKLQSLAGEAAPAGGRGGGRGGGGGAGPNTLAGIASTLSGLADGLGDADVQPTANQAQAVAAARAVAVKMNAQWQTLSTKELAALNAALTQAGLEPIK
jgi:hypothetical protein